MRTTIFRVIRGTCLAAAMLTAAMAQDAQTPASSAPPVTSARHQANPNRQLRGMTKKLALTPDQQSQLLPVLQDHASQWEAIRGDATLSPRDRHAKLKGLRDDTQAKIKAILTDSQNQAYERMRQQKRGNRTNPNV